MVESVAQEVLRDGLQKNLPYPDLPQRIDGSSLMAEISSLMSSLRKISKIAFTYAQVALLSTGNSAWGGSPPACSNPQISCQNTTSVQDTCCFNSPGGQLLQTQFWDVSPATGPVDSWTIHGLWPDHCDGTFDSNCDPLRAYTNISAIISAAGQTALLDYMNTYWKDYQGNDESFWEHEWGKHGTCVSTLEPKCYTNYSPQEEVVDFFQKTTDLFKALPSYTWLSDAGIVPSSSATYTSAQIFAALKAPRGYDVSIQCRNTNQLDEIWYFYDVQGSLQTGTFIPTNPDGSKSSCPSTGIQYLPKSSAGTNLPPPPTTTKPTATVPFPTGTTTPGIPFSGRGTLQVYTSNTPTGCIISAGTWYTTGTCATFTAAASESGFTLTSSKGKCAVQNNDLVCGSAVNTATVFTNAAGGQLAHAGSAAWYAQGVPSGRVQQTVSTHSGATGLKIVWAGS